MVDGGDFPSKERGFLQLHKLLYLLSSHLFVFSYHNSIHTTSSPIAISHSLTSTIYSITTTTMMAINTNRKSLSIVSTDFTPALSPVRKSAWRIKHNSIPRHKQSGMTRRIRVLPKIYKECKVLKAKQFKDSFKKTSRERAYDRDSKQMMMM